MAMRRGCPISPAMVRRYSRSGPEALIDRLSRPDRVWNRIPDGVRDNLIQLALDPLAPAQDKWAGDWRSDGPVQLYQGIVVISIPQNHSQSCQHASRFERSGLPVMRGHIS